MWRTRVGTDAKVSPDRKWTRLSTYQGFPLQQQGSLEYLDTGLSASGQDLGLSKMRHANKNNRKTSIQQDTVSCEVYHVSILFLMLLWFPRKCLFSVSFPSLLITPRLSCWESDRLSVPTPDLSTLYILYYQAEGQTTYNKAIEMSGKHVGENVLN